MRKRLLPLIAACSTLFITAAVARPCYAQDFPTRPVRVIVPYAAGGGSDITIRIVQAKAMELLGQSLIVDNRAGGGTLIGTRMTQTSPADGYTIGVMDPAFIINPTLVKDAGSEPDATRRSRVSGDASARLISALMRAGSVFGTRAGANTPAQPTAR